MSRMKSRMMESSVNEKIIENYTIDLVSPSTKVFPDVLFDSESTKEKRSKTASLRERQEIDENFPSTRGCPMYCLAVSQQRKIKQNFLQVQNQQHHSTMQKRKCSLSKTLLSFVQWVVLLC